MSTAMSSQHYNAFLDHAVTQSALQAEVIPRIRAALASLSKPIDVIIVELGLLEEKALGELLAEYAQQQFIELITPHAATIEQLGLSFLRHHSAIAVQADDDIMLCTADPIGDESLAIAELALGRPVKGAVATRSVINEALDTLNRNDPDLQNTDQAGGNDADLSEYDLEQLRAIAEEAPVVTLLAQMIRQAAEVGATDIHVEPTENDIVFRFRLDGILRRMHQAPLRMHAGIMSRLKILSGLNISERRLPQDGRFRMNVRGLPIDIRLSTVPSILGETAVLRLLDRSKVTLDLTSLGFSDEAIDKLETIASHRTGMLLVTGPTGSGKSTTLYALLRRVMTPEQKVFTVEDPVEHRVDGVTQLQVDPQIGLTFPTVLRSVLRQDPDIILLGEIRDSETAELAVRAALTGHLVLATLHTNSAWGAVSRLRDLDIENFLVGATLRGVMGQRLVRKLCQDCHGELETTINCQTCSSTGYKGRTVTYEIAALDQALSELVYGGATERDLQTHAAAKGFVTMADHVQELVTAGTTSAAEANRVVTGGD